MAILRNFNENHLLYIGNGPLSPGDDGFVPFDVTNGDYIRLIIISGNDTIFTPFYSKILNNGTSIIEGTAPVENSNVINEDGIEQPFTIYQDGNSNFYVKPNDVLDTLGLSEDHYRVQVDFLNRLDITDESFIVREVSVSELEVRLKLQETAITNFEDDSFINDFQEAITNDDGDYKFNYVLSVNETKNISIVNYTFDPVTSGQEDQSIILKLYEPATATGTLQTVTIEREVLITQYEDIFYKGAPDRVFYGHGLEQHTNPDIFDIPDFADTVEQSYNELVSSSFTDLTTINQIVSSSNEYPNLNLDYSGYKSHTFFGSAKQKLVNFRAKVAKIEGHFHAISQSLATTTSITGTGDNATVIENRKERFDKVQREINLLTPYERWLYYDGQMSATSSAPSVGGNYAHLYALNREASDGGNQAPSSSVTQSLDGFTNVYTIRKSGPNKTYITLNDYRVEENPFFNYSGSVYVSFLVKGGPNISGSGDFSKIHYEVDKELYPNQEDGYYTPSASIHNRWIKQPSMDSSSWKRYIGVSSASYWYPHSFADYETSGINKNQFNNPSVGQNRIRILSGSQYSKTGSSMMYADGQYQNISTVNTASGLTNFPFSGSIMPTGDIVRLILPNSGLGQESPASAVSKSFITDFKVTLRDPSNAYPFAQMYKTGSSVFDSWYDGAFDSASRFDEDNINGLINNLPLYIQESEEYDDLKLFLNMIGEQFDIIRNHIDQYTSIYNRDYSKYNSVPPNLLPIIGESLGWSFIQPYTGSQEHPLAEHFGSSLASVTDMQEVTHQTWRKTLNNLIYLYKTKGTQASIRGLLNTYGYPPDMVRISEFGGSTEEHNPAVITNDFKPMKVGLRRSNDNISFVQRKKKLYHYILFASGSTDRTIKSDWWIHDANANTVEFIYKHKKATATQELLMSSGSATASLWDLRLLSSTDGLSSSFAFRLNTSISGSLDIPRHAVSMSTDYTVMDEGTLWNVMLQRVSSSISGSGTNEYKLAAALQAEDRIPILNAVSMSISGGLTFDANRNANTNWVSTGSRHPLSSSNLYVGRTASGSMAEVRVWSTAISASKFKQHVINKFSVIGNDQTAHSDELIYHYRLNENWRSGSSDVRIKDANPNGPLENPRTYDVSMSLDLTTNSQLYGYDMVDVYTFSLRGSPQNQESSNKVIINPEQSLIGNLNPFNTVVKALDEEQSAARLQGSNKLEMTTGPSNFINDFIFK